MTVQYIVPRTYSGIFTVRRASSIIAGLTGC